MCVCVQCKLWRSKVKIIYIYMLFDFANGEQAADKVIVFHSIRFFFLRYFSLHCNLQIHNEWVNKNVIFLKTNSEIYRCEYINISWAAGMQYLLMCRTRSLTSHIFNYYISFHKYDIFMCIIFKYILLFIYYMRISADRWTNMAYHIFWYNNI